MNFYSRNIMVEQVRRRLDAGYPSERSRVQNNEIAIAINNVANTLLKIEMLNITFGVDGETLPDGVMLATYYCQVTRAYPGTASFRLPVSPMYTPENMGVFSVFPKGMPAQEFTPIPIGLFNAVVEDNLISPIADTLYTRNGMDCIVYADLIGAGVTQVETKLLIFDMNKYDGNESLPLPPELAQQVMDKVVEQYMGEPPYPREETNQPPPTS